MIPILYNPEEMQFKTNGVGMLSDAISCEVLQVLNGEYELEMVYHVRGLHFPQIRQRSIVMAKPDPVTDPQPFRVYRITKPMNGKVTIYARHIAYDMMGIPVAPFSAEGVVAALAAMKSHAVEDCPFTFSTDMISDKAITVKAPKSMWLRLGGTDGSILNTFGGEYEFDRWNVRLHNRRGLNRGVSIRYGKNLTDLKQEENCAGCYTGVYPYWTNAEGDYLELPERKIYAKGNFGYSRILTVDFSSEWTEKPTIEQLRKKTESYIADNDIGVPQVSLNLEFVRLEQTEEYRGTAILEQVFIGDTVAVEFTDMGISATARANAVRYLPMLERYKSITLGSIRSGFADIIVNQGKELEKRPNRTYMENAIAVLTNAILGARGGAVRLLDTDGDDMPDTLYIADHADPGQAKKVWRFNYEGWAASTTGYGGPFVMGASFDSGILAESITAGILQSKDGGVKIDLDKGIGNLARGTSAHLSTWDDYMGGWTKDINVVIDEFVSAELEKMQYDTIRDFAARLDSNSLYPEGVKLSLYKFRKSSGQPFASASLEWADGSRSHKTATKDSEESAWQISEMEWLSTD